MTKTSPLFTLEGLLDLACRSGVDIRPTLLRVLTDLYVQKSSHRAEEEAQYVELAQRLIDTADPITRATVAARLASYAGAPEAIMQKLQQLTGVAVTPKTATVTSPDSAAAASAPRLDPEEGLANDLVELFFGADAGERRLIVANLDVVADPTRRVPTDHATSMLVEAAILGRDHAKLARILERALAISPALAQRIIADASGEPILVVAKYLGMPLAALQRVLLLLNPAVGQSVQRVYELAELYQDISVHAAVTLVDMWRGTPRQRRSTHRPVYYDDQRTGARTAATASHARTTRRSDSLAARFRNSGR